MTEFWKRFWQSAVSLAGIAGLYLAADAGHVLWAFWLVVVLAGLIAAVTSVAPRSVEWTKKVRDYPRLLETAGRLQAETDRLKKANLLAIEQAESAREDGIEEGQAHVLGCLLAAELKRIPELVSVQVMEGVPVLFASWSGENQVVGARYDLEVTATGGVRGVVQAQEVDEQRQLVRLICVREKDPVFWRQLAGRAEVEAEPPKGLTLRPSSAVDRTVVAGVVREELVEGTRE